MTNKLLTNLLAAIVSFAFSFAVLAVSSVQAATITYDFTVEATNGSLTGNRYTGFFSYDDSLLTGVGFEFLTDAEGLTVSFDFLSATYTNQDDLGFPDFPSIWFWDGVFNKLSFAVQNKFFIGAIVPEQFSYAGGSGKVTFNQRDGA